MLTKISVGRSVGALTLVAVLSAINAANYVFHLVMTRLLGPADYGALGALLGLLLIMSVPVGAIQAVIARRVASEDDKHSASLVRSGVAGAARGGLVFAVIMAASAPLTAKFLHLTSPVPMLLLAAMMLPALVAPAARGALQGANRFGALGVGLAVSTGLRLALGVVFVMSGLGLTGAVLGIVIGETVGALFAVLPIRSFMADGTYSRAEVRSLTQEGFRTATSLLAFWLLATMDVVLVRHFLPPVVAGRYAAAALAGRMVLFLPGAVAILAYPFFVRHRGTPIGRRLLRNAITAVGALGLVATVGIVLFPTMLGTLFGPAYRAAGALAPVLALAMCGLGLANILIYYSLALGRSPSRRLWLVVGTQATAIALFHGGPGIVATLVLITSWTATAALLAVTTVQRSSATIREGELWRAADSAIDLSVVTPTFNGEAVIASSLQTLTDALASTGIRYEIIVVSDGSTDGTLPIARRFEGPGVHLLHYPHNQGKGYALRTGLARASGQTVAFIDSDGDLDPVSLVRFLTLMRMYDADMVIGSKRHPLSAVTYPVPRRIMSWCYHKLVRALFGIKVQDSQTGVKLIRRKLLAEVLPRLEERRFAFDLELLAAARRAGYRRILEAPVTLRYQFASTISWRSVRGIMRDTFAIWFRCYVTRRYDAIQPADDFDGRAPDRHERQQPAGARA
jgi:O-antigen/teichoic acid export membrane protein